MQTIAINIRTGARETVAVDGYGCVPETHRTLTERERHADAICGLREERAQLRERGDWARADQITRTLADMGVT